MPYLFAHLGLMWSLFDQAGYPPHVLLFLRGKTGSLKTAVASFLFNFEAKKETAIPATFRDTSASMEVRMGKYKDRVLLVDDFCPAASENAKRILEQNLEQLIRFYGDGIAKGRTNPRLSEVYENRPHGLCAITGEDSAGSYSSLLRCLFIDVDQATYDKVKLSTYQKNPGLWTGYLELFVEYCVANAGSIVPLVRESFPALREKGRQHLSEARLVDAFCSLSLTAAIALNFVKEYLKFTEQQVTKLNNEFSALCLACCVRSAEEARSADPVKIFVRAVHEGLAQQAILLGDKAEFVANPNKFVGCTDGRYIYFWPGEVYDFVRRQCAINEKNFPLSQNRIFNALVEAGVLIPPKRKEECHGDFEYATRVSFGNRPRLLKMDPSIFDRYL